MNVHTTNIVTIAGTTYRIVNKADNGCGVNAINTTTGKLTFISYTLLRYC